MLSFISISKNTRQNFAMCILGFFSTISSCRTLKAENKSDLSSNPNVTVEIILPSKTIVLGDPILFKVRVSNQSPGSITLLTPRLLAIGTDTIEFHLRAPNEERFFLVDHPVIYTGPRKSIAPPQYIPVTTLDHNESESWSFLLDYSFPTLQNQHWLFSNQGICKIKCQLLLVNTPRSNSIRVPFGINTIPLTSKSTSFRISKPSVAQDQKAYKDLKELRYRYLLYAPDQYRPQTDRNARSEIKAFVEANPDSRYADMGDLFLLVADLKQAIRQSNEQDYRSLINQIRNIGDDPDTLGSLIVNYVLLNFKNSLGLSKNTGAEPTSGVLGQGLPTADTVKEIRGFIREFADAIETRDIKKFRQFYPEGERGAKLAQRTENEFKELQAGKLLLRCRISEQA